MGASYLLLACRAGRSQGCYELAIRSRPAGVAMLATTGTFVYSHASMLSHARGCCSAARVSPMQAADGMFLLDAANDITVGGCGLGVPGELDKRVTYAVRQPRV
jgi:predicted ABC-type sugar transport system permease subunit